MIALAIVESHHEHSVHNLPVAQVWIMTAYLRISNLLTWRSIDRLKDARDLCESSVCLERAGRSQSLVMDMDHLHLAF